MAVAGDCFSRHRIIFDGEEDILKYFNTTDARYVMIHQPFVPFSLILCYISFCVWFGPYVMKDRAPFRLNKLIFIYDFCVVIINAYLALKLAKYSFTPNWSYHCPISVAFWVKDVLKEIHEALFYLYFTKFVELIDTVFFVLTKKSRNISFLHIFHHSVVPLGSWLIAIYDPTAFYWCTIAALNCFMHVLMYSYYGFAAIGFTKIFQYKKYLTSIQICQFLMQIAYMLFLSFHGCIQYASGCTIGGSILFVFCILFLNFYRQNFIKKRQD